MMIYKVCFYPMIGLLKGLGYIQEILHAQGLHFHGPFRQRRQANSRPVDKSHQGPWVRQLECSKDILFKSYSFYINIYIKAY